MRRKPPWLFLAGSTLVFGAQPAAAQSVSQWNAETGENDGTKQGPGGGMESPGLTLSGWAVPDSLERQETVEASARPEAPQRPPSDEWEFTLAPYVWAMSLSAQADVGPISGSSEACFSELAQKLDLAAQLRFEGLRKRWGFYLDGTYVSLGDDARAKVGPFRIRGIDVDAQFTTAWLDFGGMYRFGEPGRTFDLLVGGRYSYLATDLSIGPFLDVDASEDFIAPMVGGRVQYDLGKKLVLSIKGEVGGFGIGDAADLVWGATALLGYRLNDRATLGFGYRYYDLDLSSGGLDADLQMHGPLVGVAFRF